MAIATVYEQRRITVWLLIRTDTYSTLDDRQLELNRLADGTTRLDNAPPADRLEDFRWKLAPRFCFIATSWPVLVLVTLP